MRQESKPAVGEFGREEEWALLKESLAQHRRTLAKLEKKKAMYSPLERPISLLSEIDAEKQEIQSIEQHLAQLAEKSPPAPTSAPTLRLGRGEPLPLVEIVTFSGQRVRGWLINVIRDPLWQGIGGIVAVLALVVAIGAWFWPDIRPLLFPAMPTVIPMPSEEVVKGFLTTKEGRLAVTVKPGTTITATIEEIVDIKVEFSTTYQEKDLVFTWYTCRMGSSPVLQRIGNPEMVYIAPNEPGMDCIVVVVEKESVQLGRDEIFVDVQK